ncbi:MAG: HTH-type transcriptional repressor AseR [candidate division BRC1 bacterium ADurb.Bin183]|nr:MAG: HTH-type transcriptional repressor AseR [candidate division BRC1 bacterium ADurb.Bin183]
MNKKRLALLEARARILKAMAHPTRLFIMETLSQREACVCKLSEMIGADISTVSKHLTVLKNAGIVLDEKRGSQVFYNLRCPCILDFFDCVETVIKTATEAQIKLARALPASCGGFKKSRL